MKAVKEVQKLFEPINIGKMQLKNRIAMGAMIVNLASKEGYVTERLKDYHADFAKGGVALNTTEAAYISPEGRRLPGQLAVDNDKFIPGLKELANVVHQNDGKISLQLHHGGRESAYDMTGLQPVAPTDLPSTYRTYVFIKGVEIPRQLSIPEIEELVEKFGDGARRAKEAGFDAVEVHGAHGYLICNFLSPFSNRRTDKYGGDLEGRLRFTLEAVEAARAGAGPDLPIPSSGPLRSLLSWPHLKHNISTSRKTSGPVCP